MMLFSCKFNPLLVPQAHHVGTDLQHKKKNIKVKHEYKTHNFASLIEEAYKVISERTLLRFHRVSIRHTLPPFCEPLQQER